MEDKTNGERKKLSLSLGGKLTLKNSVSSSKPSNSITTNTRTGRGTVQVEVKRTKRPSGRLNLDAKPDSTNGSTLSVKEIQSRSKMLQEGLAKTAAQAEILATEKIEKTKIDEARIAANAQEASEAASSLAPKDKMLARRKVETEEILEIKKIEDEQKKVQSEAKKAEEAALQAEKDRQKLADDETLSNNNKAWTGNKVQEKEIFRENTKKPSWNRGIQEKRQVKMTIARALDSDNVRVRSLASIKRRREKVRMQADQTPAVKQFREVIIPDTIMVSELATRMTERTADVVRELMKNGIMATATEVIDGETAELITTEFGHKPKRISESDVEIDLMQQDNNPENLTPRPPIVTIMGHVDHGKTSLLDAIRNTKVVTGEAGGITQHIGAYQVRTDGGAVLSFLDTPGHAAFTSMRSRGAQVTDIVVLVVAADDAVMPQTVEAINHAKAAEVPVIVAINKIDKPEANPDKVRTDLLQHEIIVEKLSGEVQDVEVSAIDGQGLDELLEAIALQAEILELKANPDRAAQGAVIEAQLDVGRGPVATVLVQKGTLNQGDIFVVGEQWGKVRALINDKGERIKTAGPSVPVEVLGLNGTPEAGDVLNVVDAEAQAREIADYRADLAKEKRAAAGAATTLEQLMAKAKEDENVSELPILVKADVQGSAEAIVQAMEKIGNSEVRVRVLHSGVGAITETDIGLAEASGAPVMGFNVRANASARNTANQKSVEIRYYSVIYDLVDDVKAAASGLLSAEIRETFIGYAKIKEVFKVSGVGKVAGCLVTEGVARRSAGVRLLRDDVVIHVGTLKTLKRFKDEVPEVQSGQECGMAFENYDDIRADDVIEIFERQEVKRVLD